MRCTARLRPPAYGTELYRRGILRSLLCAACGCVASAAFDGVIDSADGKWQMDR